MAEDVHNPFGPGTSPVITPRKPGVFDPDYAGENDPFAREWQDDFVPSPDEPSSRDPDDGD